MKKICLLTLAFSALSHADDALIREQLTGLGLENVEIIDTPIANLRQVISERGNFFATTDGQYFLQGSLYQLQNNQMRDLTLQAFIPRLEAQAKDSIEYKSENEKHIVYVFFDITCHYCQLMFQQTKAYNDLGITMRYLAFPRQGPGSKNARQMESIWQSKNRHEALEAAKNGKAPAKEAPVDYVRKQYELGALLGISGTPSIFSQQGELIVGYLPPQQLLERLEEASQ